MERTPKSGADLLISVDVLKSIGFGSLLRTYRTRGNLTRSELADSVPCDRSTIFKLENGVRLVNYEMAIAIIKALNLNPQDEAILKASAPPERVGLQNFGGLLKELRQSRDLTQSEMGRILGCDQSFLSKVERGLRPLGKVRIEDLKIKFSVTDEEIDQLLSASQ